MTILGLGRLSGDVFRGAAPAPASDGAAGPDPQGARRRRGFRAASRGTSDGARPGRAGASPSGRSLNHRDLASRFGRASGRRKRWGLLPLPAALATLAAAPAPLTPALSAQSTRPEIVRVGFAGNVAFSDAELRRAVVTTASRCPPILALTCAIGLDWLRDRQYFSRRVLDDDVSRLQQLYRANGFRGTEVTPEVGDDTTYVEITFRINEGTLFRVGSIVFLGDSLPDGAMADDLPVAPGDPASYLLIAARDTLTLRLRDAGFAHAEVFYGFDRARASDTASVSYRVDLGPPALFGPVEVAGNRLLDDDVILARLPFREGEPFRESAIIEGQRSLHELGIVARAQVRRDTARMTTDSVMPIRVDVVEGDMHRVRFGGGANSAECLNVEGRWASRNFFGGGRTLQAQARLSHLLADLLVSTPLCAQAGTGEFGRLNWLAGVDFSEPAFLSLRNSVSLGLFAERQSRRNIFVRDALGLDLGFGRALGAGSSLGIRFQPQLSRLAAAEVTLCAAFLACTPDDIEALSSTNWLSPVAFSLSRDRSDNIFNPATGSRALFDLEIAGAPTGSDYAYLRAFADASLYRPVGTSSVLALRLRAGRIFAGGFRGFAGGDERFADVVPSEKRFYGGGPNSVRGFDQNTLGPRSLSIGVEELLRRRSSDSDPVCIPAAVLARVCDASPLREGDLFQLRPIGGLSTVEASAELRFPLAGTEWGGAVFVDVGQVWPRGPVLDALEASPGVGIRYNSPFGPFRLDLAYSFRVEEPLQVITSQIRPWVAGVDAAADRIDIAAPGSAPEPIDWVISEDLAILPPVLFGDPPGFDLRRFQLQFSIGQAF